MIGFSLTEQWMRGSTLLAGYRIARSTGASIEEAQDRAYKAMERSHGIYGKATLPMVAQGTGVTEKGMRLFVAYLKFPHTYLQTLHDLGFKNRNIKALLYNMIAPVVVGGGKAIPFLALWLWMLKPLFKLLGVDDPEKWVWDTIGETLGYNAEKAARHGLSGMAGVDISGSLSIGAGIPTKFSELFGIGGGLYEDVVAAGDYIGKGLYGRAAEKILPSGVANIPRAIREANEGITTGRGKRVWDETGKPMKPNTYETIARGFGFRSVDQAVIQERVWETKQAEARLKGRRDDIYEQVRAWIADYPDGARDNQKAQKEWSKIMVKVNAYNIRVDKAGVGSKIKRSGIKRQAMSMTKPTKQEKRRLL